MSLEHMSLLLTELGYVKQDEEFYKLTDENVGAFLEGAPAIDYRRRLTGARMQSEAAYQKELVIVQEHRKQLKEKQMKEQ